MSFLVKFKDHISSVGVIVAIVFSSLALLSNPKTPDLVVSSEVIDNLTTRVVVYNGGDGPCAGFKISYSNVYSFVEQIVQYQESALPNKKLDVNKQGETVIAFPARAPDKVGRCEQEKCKINGEFLAPNQAFALDFKKINTAQKAAVVNFLCYEDDASIRV